MSYTIFLFFFIAFTVMNLQLEVHGDECRPSRCGGSNVQPEVRYPFRIKGKQPKQCGYPLSCSQNNHTVLHLTPSWNLIITNIDYKTQLISAYDADDSQINCLPRRLLSLNSTLTYLTPFQFKLDINPIFHLSVISTYTFVNCSTEFLNHSDSEIGCLSNSDYKVYAVEAYDIEDYLDLFMSCIKIHNISAISRDYVYSNHVTAVELTWYDPDCISCEAKGGHCTRLSSSHQIQCHGQPNPGLSTKFIATGITLGSILLVGAVVLVYQLISYNKTRREYESKINKFLGNYKSFKPTRFSYAHIDRMTNKFKDKLGQGAYGTVFRGKLSEEIMVAVKLLNNSKGNGEEFINEVQTIGRIHHVNVVRLVGFCADGFRRALVYEYLPNDSLQKFISSPDTRSHFLGWSRLEDIGLGIAKGIEYLHQGCDQRILHFDIKPQNVLLDQDFNPKITDFGLAKLCGKDQSAVSMTTAKGTIGYMAPEVFSRNFGNVSYKSDVYSFGMLVLEMVGGRKVVQETRGSEEHIYFPEWIYNLLEEEEEDLRLEIEGVEDAKIAKKLAIVGLWCIQWNPADRPSMKTVIKVLEGEGENLTKPPNPFHSEASARTNTKLPRRRLQLEMDVIAETE